MNSTVADVLKLQIAKAICPGRAIDAHANLKYAIYEEILVERYRSEIGGLPRREADAHFK